MAVYFTLGSVRRRVVSNQLEREKVLRGSRDGIIQTHVSKSDVEIRARSFGERMLRRNQLRVGAVASELTDAFRWPTRRRRCTGCVYSRMRRGEVDRICPSSREKVNSGGRNHGPFATAG